MAFENDLLISYAHVDDQALVEGQPGWISTLHRLLEIRVAQLLGETPKIWRDPKLQGNDYFADTITEEQIPRSAALLAILSPRYVQSEWCTREVREFCQASEQSGGLRVGDKARIFKVVKTPVPRERHPDELQPLLGYEFYVTDPQTGRPRELSQAYGPDAERQFLTRLDDLAYDICKLLEVLKSNGSPAQRAAPRATVYLAETSHDLQDEREALRRELAHNGVQVLPTRSLPLVAGELDAFVRQQLARCMLSIHFVGQGYGVVPDGETRSTVVLQHEIAAGRSADGLKRLLWLPPGLEVSDDRQRTFIEHLRSDPGTHAGAELLEVPLEDLKSLVHQKLAPPKPKKERTRTIVGGPLRVYLICDQPDLESTQPLVDFLFDQGLEVVPSLFDPDEAAARQEHEESLCTSDAVLVYYGTSGELWLRRKLREIQKSAGLGRDRPLLARGIYVAPPLTPQKERFRTLEAMVLPGTAEGFTPPALGPFLAEIARQKAAAQ